MARWVRFFLMIVLGAAAAMYYGWIVNPVEYIDTTPDSLRMDYKTDFVLMVAEAYHGEGHLGMAARRLAILGNEPPLEIVNHCIEYATQIGYNESDLALMKALADAMKTWNPSLEVPPP